MSGRIIIVSNRLPLSAHESKGRLEFIRSNGGLATALASIFDPASARWVGWPGLRRRLKHHELHHASISSAYELIGLENDTLTGFYDHIANGVWWPMLHGLEPTIKAKQSDWNHAHDAIEKFADTLVATVEPDDIIWIHDYQLFWLPQMLRDRKIKNKIGFFLHTPFLVTPKVAQSKSFRAVISSLATVDLLGMQTKRDVEHWQKVANKNNIPLSAQAFPIGITTADFVRKRLTPRVQALISRHRQKVGLRTVIISISRLDYTKGLIEELEGFRLFLRNAKRPGNYIFRLNVAPSRESVSGYNELQRKVQKTVDTINKEFSHLKHPPVWYTYDNMDINHMIAWYRVARIHLNTPVADGMNLVIKEYIASRVLPGMVIMSDSMGAADELTSGLIVPPGDVKAIADAIQEAVTMPRHILLKRWTKLQKAVFSHQAKDWANEFLAELENTSRN